jgi:hypothetical protein
MGGCSAESRQGAVWGEGDRDQGGHGVRGRSCAGVSRPTEARRRVRARDVHRTGQFLLPVGSFFAFVSFFSRTVFLFCHGLVSFFSRKAARCERCSPWKKRKYLVVHVRRIRSCSFWTFFTFFLSKRNSGQETGRGARGNRTARDQERRGMAAVGDGGGRLGLKYNKNKTKKRTQVTSNN